MPKAVAIHVEENLIGGQGSGERGIAGVTCRRHQHCSRRCKVVVPVDSGLTVGKQCPMGFVVAIECGNRTGEVGK